MPAQPKLTPDVRDKLVTALRAGATRGMASVAVGVSRQALDKAAKRNKAFAAEIEAACEFADARVVKRLFEKALAGDTTAMIFWLKNRQPDKWRDRHELTGTGAFPESLTLVLAEAPTVGLEAPTPALDIENADAG